MLEDDFTLSIDYNKTWEDYEKGIWLLDSYRYLKSYKLLEGEKIGKLLGIARANICTILTTLLGRSTEY